MIYLLHLDKPLHHARHYLGFVDGDYQAVQRRLQEHREGRGARMLAHCNALGITYTLAAVWPGDRQRERQLKNWKCTPDLCPICNPLIYEKIVRTCIPPRSLKPQSITSSPKPSSSARSAGSVRS